MKEYIPLVKKQKNKKKTSLNVGKVISKILLFNDAWEALVVKKPPANAGDTRDVGLIPGLGRSPGGGSDTPLQYSSLGNIMDRGAWQATVHEVAKSLT